MLSRLLRELLFALLHAIITMIELLKEVNDYLNDWWSPKTNLENEVGYIARRVAALKRKPQHLVVMVTQECLNTKELADLALWSLLAGVPYLSFYDSDGTLKCKEDELFTEVEKRKYGVPGLIKWTHKPDLNGYSNGHRPFTCTIKILTRNHGKEMITQVVRDLMQHKVSCHRKEEFYTSEELDLVIKMYYPNVPDPDLLTYCGPVCMTRGLMPWQIRLTEFVPLKKYKRVCVQDFFSVLERFNKCDQRFGK